MFFPVIAAWEIIYKSSELASQKLQLNNITLLDPCCKIEALAQICKFKQAAESGSARKQGKTTLAKRLASLFGPGSVIG